MGVNRYVEDENGPTIDIHRIDSGTEKEAVSTIEALRKSRDNARVKSELDDIREACRGDGNLLERFVSAAHAYCTLGEIAQVLREEFGEYKEPKIL